MSATPWTPGPWFVWSKSSTTVMGPHRWRGQRLVANTGGYSTTADDGEHQDENDANACLIALAPEMADALRTLAERHAWSPELGPCVCEAHQTARAILARLPPHDGEPRA